LIKLSNRSHFQPQASFIKKKSPFENKADPALQQSFPLQNQQSKISIVSKLDPAAAQLAASHKSISQRVPSGTNASLNTQELNERMAKIKQQVMQL